MGKREHCSFVGFKRDLLGKHHIASRQSSTVGNETPTDHGQPRCVDLYNIAHGAIVDSISSAGVTTCDFEIIIGVKLRTLIRRQPFAEKTTRTGLRPVLLDEALIESAHNAQTRSIDASSSEQKHFAAANSL
ncbi:hypothetical protein ACVWXN_000469 [Bradyrhizobium sp. i1.4.4]